MNTRKFGRTGWQVSDIGYGMWGMAGWQDSNDEESMRSLQLSVDLGCTFFDTAWGYGEGKSEVFLGQLLKANPDRKLYAASKIPPKNFSWPSRREFTLDDCFPPDHIEEYLNLSLENLGRSSLDLIQFHTWEDSWLEDDRLAKSISDIKSQGLAKAVGISINRWETWNGLAAVKSGLIDSVQVIYNIFDQNPVDQLFPLCQENDVAVIARVPFDEGTLTGNINMESTWPDDDWRSSYFVDENLKSSVEHADLLRPIVPAEMTLPEMALRFCISDPRVSTVIPGMRKERNVRSNMACSEKGALGLELLQTLSEHRWDREPTSWSQ